MNKRIQENKNSIENAPKKVKANAFDMMMGCKKAPRSQRVYATNNLIVPSSIVRLGETLILSWILRKTVVYEKAYIMVELAKLGAIMSFDTHTFVKCFNLAFERLNSMLADIVYRGSWASELKELDKCVVKHANTLLNHNKSDDARVFSDAELETICRQLAISSRLPTDLTEKISQHKLEFEISQLAKTSVDSLSVEYPENCARKIMMTAVRRVVPSIIEIIPQRPDSQLHL